MARSERILSSIFEQIAEMAARNNVPQMIIDRAYGIYEQIVDRQIWTRYDVRPAVCLYIACRFEAILIKTLLARMNFSVSEVIATV